MQTFKDQVFTRKELARYIGCSVSTVDRGFEDCLQPFPLGGTVLYDRAQAERHFENVLKNHGRCGGECKKAVEAAPIVGSRIRRPKGDVLKFKNAG